jgi:hypothetical protein
MGVALLDALRVTEAPARPVEAATPRPVLRPADSRRGACAWCLRDVAAREPGAHAQEHRDPSGAAVRMLWHGACADAPVRPGSRRRVGKHPGVLAIAEPAEIEGLPGMRRT